MSFRIGSSLSLVSNRINEVKVAYNQKLADYQKSRSLSGSVLESSDYDKTEIKSSTYEALAKDYLESGVVVNFDSQNIVNELNSIKDIVVNSITLNATLDSNYNATLETDLQDVIDSLNPQLVSAQADLNVAQADLDAATAIQSDIQVQLDTVNKDIVNTNTLVADNTTAITNTQTAITDTNTALVDNQAALDTGQLDLDALLALGSGITQADIDAMTQEVADQQALVDANQVVIDDLNVEQASEQALLDTNTTAITDTTTQIADQEALNVSDQATIDTNNATITDLGTQNLTPQSDIDALNTQIADNQTTIDGLTAQIATDLTTVDAFTTTIADNQTTIEALDSTIVNNQAVVDTLTAEQTTLNDQLSSLQTDLTALNTDKTTFKSTLTDLNTQKTDLETNLAGQTAAVDAFTTVRDDAQTVFNDLNSQLNTATNDLNTFDSEKDALLGNLDANQTSINASANYIDAYLTQNGYSSFEFATLNFDASASDNDTGAINLASLSVNSAAIAELNGDNADSTLDALVRLDAAIAEVEAWTSAETGVKTVSTNNTLHHYYNGQKLTADTIMAREELLTVESQIDGLDDLREKQTNLAILFETLTKHNTIMESLAIGFANDSVNLTANYINKNSNSGFARDFARDFATRAQVGSYGVASNFSGSGLGNSFA